MKSFYFQIIIIISLLLSNKADAIVNYEKGAIIVRGVQLLQDRDDPKQYFYVPTYPRLSMKPDSTLEFLCLKYVGLKLRNKWRFISCTYSIYSTDSRS